MRVSPLPLVQIQARAALSAFDSPSLLNTSHELAEIEKRYKQLQEVWVNPKTVHKEWHRFQPMEQYDYRDALIDAFPWPPTSNFTPSSEKGSAGQVNSAEQSSFKTPAWHREMYLRKDILRRTWRALEARGEADDWVRGVGAGENPEEEWEALLRKIIEKGEKDEGIRE